MSLKRVNYSVFILVGVLASIISGTLASNTSNQLLPPVFAKKPVVITFDDDWVGQYKYAVPILQKFHYNATFFVTCLGPTELAPSFIRGQSPDITTWDQLKQIKAMKFDIQNHGMTHHKLEPEASAILQREIVDSLSCLNNHLNVKAKVFAPAHAGPENDPVVNSFIEKGGYEFARNGYGSGRFDSPRFALPTNSVNSLDKQFNHNTQAIVSEFARQMEKSQLPVLVFHNINFLNQTNANRQDSTTTPETFQAEMAWLANNGYEVHSIADLKWDSQKERFTL